MLNYVIITALFVGLIGIQLRNGKNQLMTLPNLFAIYWAVLICVGIGLYLNSFQFSYVSFYWVFLMCAVYYAVYHFAIEYIPKQKIFGRIGEKQHYLQPQYIYLVFLAAVVCIVLRVVGVFYYMYLNSISLLDLVSPSRFSGTLDILTQLKYNIIPLNFSNLISIANTLSFTGLLLFGFYCSEFSLRQRIVTGVLAVFSFCFSMVIFASKADVIFAVLIFLSTLIVRLIIDEFDLLQWVRQHKKAVLVILGAGVAVIVVLTLFIVIRSQFQKSPIDGLKQYGFGMIPAFDYYFTNLRPESLSFGKYTFLGILDFLGFGDPNLPQGVYEMVDLGPGNYPSNIFTAFRSLIDDFGLTGCLLVFVVLGGLTAVLTAICKKNKQGYFSICILSFTAFFLLNSFLISAGNYFSLCLAYGFLYVFLVAMRIAAGFLERKGRDIRTVLKKKNQN